MARFWKYKLDHWLFWGTTIFFHAYTRLWLIPGAGSGQFLLEIFVRNMLLAAVIYLNLLILIPRFPQQKKYLSYALMLLTSLVVYALLKDLHDRYLYGYVLGDEERTSFFRNTFYNMSIALFYVAFSIAMHLSKEWYFQKELIRKIEIEKLNTELEYLKAQINPHFLFNSINTIYFQIEKENTQARETLMTLSEMLRYQLYECNGKEVSIEKEVSYLKNYAGLQRARRDENCTITFMSGPDVSNFAIVPLLLIPFVENAFKHVSHFTHETNEVRIHLHRTGNLFRLQVFNTTDGQPASSGGIGLKNAKRRLELLYPGRHFLTIRETEKEFEVDLELQLA